MPPLPPAANTTTNVETAVVTTSNIRRNDAELVLLTDKARQSPSIMAEEAPSSSIVVPKMRFELGGRLEGDGDGDGKGEDE
mmetsp:Transcript_9163/g.22766  ORF Transcript_9163/g.22766 Transcript_9163/m.22766 type:complete len:81 (+) Transcript_9163:3580-3822(+)